MVLDHSSSQSNIWQKLSTASVLSFSSALSVSSCLPCWNFLFSQELDYRFSWFKKQFLFLDDFKMILFKTFPQKMFHFRYRRSWVYFSCAWEHWVLLAFFRHHKIDKRGDKKIIQKTIFSKRPQCLTYQREMHWRHCKIPRVIQKHLVSLNWTEVLL